MTWVLLTLFITWAILFIYGCLLFLKERALRRRCAALESNHA